MASLSDAIESYIKRMLAMAREGAIELRRRDLAEQFACVPSQITYVLATRFTPERGYIVETRRGGAGYIRIERIRWRRPELVGAVYERRRAEVSEGEAERLLTGLEESGVLSAQQVRLIRRVLMEDIRELDPAWRGVARAMFLKGCLLMAIHDETYEGGPAGHTRRASSEWREDS